MVFAVFFLSEMIVGFWIFLLFGVGVKVAAKTGRWEDSMCFGRDLAGGGRICVCNATHCDSVPSLPPFPSRMFNVYRSDGQGSSEIYQKIIGFGGTLSDATVINMEALSERSRYHLLASYFSETGLEYNMVRIAIGGNDYSNRSYTLDDVEGDVFLESFSLSPEDLAYKIPHLKSVGNFSKNGVRILATAWTAPPWMKTNGDYTGFGFLKDEYYSLWSKYHLKFLEEYGKLGVKVWAVTTGHQPSAGLIPFYPYNCMGWTPFSQAQWISDHLGPDLRNSKYNATKIIAVDDSRFFLPWWPKLMFDNQKAKSFVTGIGVQWYWNFLFPPRLLDLTHAEFPGHFILSTEASFNKWRGFSEPVALGSWDRAEEYAESIIDDLNHWTSGWIDSNLALDLQGGPSWAENFADAAIVINSSANEFYKQPMFYVMGHFSKFIVKGSSRINVKVSKSGVKATGVRTPRGNVVIVLVNKNTYDIPITIIGAKMGNANTLLPKKSIITVIYRDKK